MEMLQEHQIRKIGIDSWEKSRENDPLEINWKWMYRECAIECAIECTAKKNVPWMCCRMCHRMCHRFLIFIFGGNWMNGKAVRISDDSHELKNQEKIAIWGRTLTKGKVNVPRMCHERTPNVPHFRFLVNFSWDIQSFPQIISWVIIIQGGRFNVPWFVEFPCLVVDIVFWMCRGCTAKVSLVKIAFFTVHLCSRSWRGRTFSNK